MILCHGTTIFQILISSGIFANKKATMENVKIAISGELGSGKTVLGKLICEELNFRLISVGVIQRELAEKYGMTNLEFNKYMETHPEIDHECDNKVVEYGKSESNLILDSRLAWHFVPSAFKLHLLVNINIAGKRVFNDKVRKNESNADIDDTIANIKARKASEIKRFKEQYNVDIDNLSNYDLAIDTSFLTNEGTYEFLLDKINKWSNKQAFPKIWLSPKNLYPQKSIGELSLDKIAELTEKFGKDNVELPLVKVTKKDSQFHITCGHTICSAALKSGIDLIPVEMDLDAEISDTEETIITEWQSAHKFEFVR